MARSAGLRLVRPDEVATDDTARPLRAGPLRKLLLCCVGEDPGVRTAPDAAGLAQRLSHHWEWLDRAVAGAHEPALAAARSLGGPVDVDRRLGAPGVAPADDEVAGALEGLAATGCRGALLLVDAAVLATVWRLLLGVAPPEPVHFATLGLLTWRAGSGWTPGRRSSDPPPLRSALERDGLEDLARLDAAPSRHVAPLQIGGVRR